MNKKKDEYYRWKYAQILIIIWGWQIFNESPYRIIAIVNVCAYDRRRGRDKNCGRWMHVSISGYNVANTYTHTHTQCVSHTYMQTYQRDQHVDRTLKRKMCMYFIESAKKFASGIISNWKCEFIEFCDLMWYFGVHNLSAHWNTWEPTYTHTHTYIQHNCMRLWLIY